MLTIRPGGGRLASAALLGVIGLGMAAAGAAHAQTQSVLYRFSGGSDGAEPRGTLIADRAGNLYGTTYRGGTLAQCAGVGCGTVFELSPPATGQTQWSYSVLHSFAGVADGANPSAGLVMDAQGNLYGETQRGGSSNCGGFGCGTVFRLSPPAGGSTGWALTALHGFAGVSDGAFPMGELTFDASGNLLGTTSQGGNGRAGTVFRLDAPAANIGAWTEELLYQFTGLTDGGNPGAAVTVDGAGNIYGTAVNGGGGLAGVVFELAPPATKGGAWAQSVLFSFPGGAAGGYPRSALNIDSAGVLYGVATNTAYSLSPPVAGGAWGETILHSFLSFGDGNIPLAGLAMVNYANSTAFYGTAGFGSSGRVGAVYKLVAPSGAAGWTESLLYRFTGAADGGNPYGGLTAAPGGVLYGTTTFGGTLGACDVGCGVVFALTMQ